MSAFEYKTENHACSTLPRDVSSVASNCEHQCCQPHDKVVCIFEAKAATTDTAVAKYQKYYEDANDLCNSEQKGIIHVSENNDFFVHLSSGGVPLFNTLVRDRSHRAQVCLC